MCPSFVTSSVLIIMLISQAKCVTICTTEQLKNSCLHVICNGTNILPDNPDLLNKTWCQLTIKCSSRDEVQNFAILPTNKNVSQLEVLNCYIINALDISRLNIIALSVRSSTFAATNATNSLPNFGELTHLEIFTFEDNSLITNKYEPRYQHLSFNIADATRCANTIFTLPNVTVLRTTTQNCFCEHKHLVNLFCFGASTAEILATLSVLRQSNQSIASVYLHNVSFVDKSGLVIGHPMFDYTQLNPEEVFTTSPTNFVVYSCGEISNPRLARRELLAIFARFLGLQSSIVTLEISGCLRLGILSLLGGDSDQFVHPEWFDMDPDTYGLALLDPRSRKLRKVNLERNNFSFSEIKTFAESRSFGTDLSELSLAQNHLIKLDKSFSVIFADIHLEKVDLSYNKIEYISTGTFDLLQNLKYLNLSHNHLVHVKPNVFNTLANLVNLDLSHNTLFGVLSSTPRHLAVWPDSLLYLNLSDNVFTDELSTRNLKFVEDFFLGLDNLVHLVMRNWGMKKPTERMFKPLRSLQTLDISFSDDYITMDERDTSFNITYFAYLGTLRHLILRNIVQADSTVFSHPCELFAPMILLESLDISNCHATDVVSCKNTTQFRDWLQHWLDILQVKLLNVEHTYCNDGLNGTIPISSYWLTHKNYSKINWNTTQSAVQLSKVLTLSSDESVAVVNSVNPETVESLFSWQNFRTPIIVMVTLSVVIFLMTAPESLLRLRCLKHLSRDMETSIRRKDSCEIRKQKSMKIKHVKKEFYSSSLIHGISYAYSSPWIVEKITWYLLILVFTAIFASDAAALWVQYQYGDPSTTVSMVNVPTFAQQPFTVCLPVKARNLNFTPQDIRALMTGDACTDHDSGLLIDVIAMRIGVQMGWEGTMLNKKPHVPAWMKTLDKEFRLQNISYMAKLQEVSTVLCSRLDINAYEYLKNEVHSLRGKSVLERDKTQTLNELGCREIFKKERFGVTWFDYTASQQMCLRFPGLFNFMGYEVQGALSFAPVVFLPGEHATVDLNGHYYPKTARQTLLPALVGMHHKTYLLVKVKSHIKNLDFFRNSSQRCYKNCVAFTRVEEIQKTCACRPLMWPEYSDQSLPECSLSKYDDCNLSLKGKVNECSSTVPCEYWDYSTTTIDHGSTHDNTTVIIFGGINSMFVVYEEIYTRTWHNFLADLGGVLGLWLGGSVMACIHVLVFIFKVLYIGFTSRLAANAPKQSPVHV